jgi:hypothetical protein
MTNLEAIKGKVNYPLSENSFKVALQDRGLVDSATYSDKKSLELTRADLCYILISSPNIIEGGYSISLTDKKMLAKVADGIFAKYGLVSPLAPKAIFINVW